MRTGQDVTELQSLPVLLRLVEYGVEEEHNLHQTCAAEVVDLGLPIGVGRGGGERRLLSVTVKVQPTVGEVEDACQLSADLARLD